MKELHSWDPSLSMLSKQISQHLLWFPSAIKWMGETGQCKMIRVDTFKLVSLKFRKSLKSPPFTVWSLRIRLRSHSSWGSHSSNNTAVRRSLEHLFWKISCKLFLYVTSSIDVYHTILSSHRFLEKYHVLTFVKTGVFSRGVRASKVSLSWHVQLSSMIGC